MLNRLSFSLFTKINVLSNFVVKDKTIDRIGPKICQGRKMTLESYRVLTSNEKLLRFKSETNFELYVL